MHPSHLARPLLLFTAFCAILLLILSRYGFFAREPSPRLAAFARIKTTAVEGVVDSPSSPKRPGERYWVKVHKTGETPHLDHPYKALVYISRKDPDAERLRAGQTVRLIGRLRLPFWPRTEGDFDERSYMEYRRADFVMHAREVRIIDDKIPFYYRPWAWGESVHRHIQAFLRRRFPKTEASMLEGLLLGFCGPLPKEISSAVQNAGTMHLLSASGGNVTTIWGWALGFGLLLGLGPRPRWILGAAAATIYIFIVGLEPPYTRAYLMGLVLLGGRLLERDPGVFHALCAAALCSWIFWPQSIVSPGFELSYLAVLAIVLGAARRGFSLAATAFLSISVQAVLLPSFAEFFGGFSWPGFLVNIVCVPGAVLSTAVGFSAWALESLFGEFCGRPAVLLMKALLAAFIWINEKAAAWPGAFVSLAPFTVPERLAYYGALGGIFVFPDGKKAGVCLAACALLLVGERLFQRAFGEVLVASFHSPPRGSVLRRGSLRVKELQIQFEPWGAVVSVGRKDVYCVRTAPSEKGLLRCPGRRTFSTFREGTIRLFSDGTTIQFESAHEGDLLRGFVP